MIFADKLIKLRRQKHWSQEELAERMHVTRQSVSKWESMQSLPDLDRIVQLSELFGVSTDYLLKDEIEEEQAEKEADNGGRYVSVQEADDFIAVKKASAVPISTGVFLCIISPICLLMLGALSENIKNYISENMAGGLGIIVMLAFIAAAVMIFIVSGTKTSKFEYMEKEIIKTDSSIIKKVKYEKEQFSKKYIWLLTIGVILCILSLIPIFVGAMIDEDNDIVLTAFLCITIFIAAVGVMVLTRVNIINNAYNMLLQEGDYSKEKKKRNPLVSVVSTVYWLTATAVYLIWSFLTNDWEITWLVFVVAGVLFPAVAAVVNLIVKRKQ